MSCINSRDKGEYVYRRYSCACGERVTTMEIVVPNTVSGRTVQQQHVKNEAARILEKIYASND